MGLVTTALKTALGVLFACLIGTCLIDGTRAWHLIAERYLAEEGGPENEGSLLFDVDKASKWTIYEALPQKTKPFSADLGDRAEETVVARRLSGPYLRAVPAPGPYTVYNTGSCGNLLPALQLTTTDLHEAVFHALINVGSYRDANGRCYQITSEGADSCISVSTGTGVTFAYWLYRRLGYVPGRIPAERISSRVREHMSSKRGSGELVVGSYLACFEL